MGFVLFLGVKAIQKGLNAKNNKEFNQEKSDELNNSISGELEKLNKLFKSANRIVGIIVDKIIITPPIVGVPCFSLWESGPWSLIDSPIWRLISFLTTNGPNIKLINSAKIALAPALKVIYSKRFKKPKYSLSGNNNSFNIF